MLFKFYELSNFIASPEQHRSGVRVIGRDGLGHNQQLGHLLHVGRGLAARGIALLDGAYVEAPEDLPHLGHVVEAEHKPTPDAGQRLKLAPLEQP